MYSVLLNTYINCISTNMVQLLGILDFLVLEFHVDLTNPQIFHEKNVYI